MGCEIKFLTQLFAADGPGRADGVLAAALAVDLRFGALVTDRRDPGLRARFAAIRRSGDFIGVGRRVPEATTRAPLEKNGQFLFGTDCFAKRTLARPSGPRA